MNLTLEEIKNLVYDARMMPNASIAELLTQFLPKPRKVVNEEVELAYARDKKILDNLRGFIKNLPKKKLINSTSYFAQSICI